MEYEAVIGLEVHVQLATESKIFCGCSTKFGAPANTQTCSICLGLPGTLPVLNKEVLELALKVALALNCQVNETIKFDRKNYFYPDLPKNFQISQYDRPLAFSGYLDIDTDTKIKRIRIRRVHLEEDTGKLIHEQGASLIDFNRSGVPLLEIVTEADINSPEEGYRYLECLKVILEYLEVSDCNMEEGSLRCDANISVHIKGESTLGTKTEIKNMNSFKAVKGALEFEYNRQKELLAEGKEVVQETRLWDAQSLTTHSMRCKEEAYDYRYFPEPDLMPLTITKANIKRVRDSLPELPAQRSRRFIDEYGIPEYDSKVLTSDKHLADYFEECVQLYPGLSTVDARKNRKAGVYDRPKIISNWIMTELLNQLNMRGISIVELKLRPSALVSMLEMIEEGVISGKIAKRVLGIMVDTGYAPEEIVKREGLAQISDAGALKGLIERTLEDNPRAVSDFRRGKREALVFLVGQIMAKTKGRANPKKVNEILKEKLNMGGQDG